MISQFVGHAGGEARSGGGVELVRSGRQASHGGLGGGEGRKTEAQRVRVRERLSERASHLELVESRGLSTSQSSQQRPSASSPGCVPVTESVDRRVARSI